MQSRIQMIGGSSSEGHQKHKQQETKKGVLSVVSQQRRKYASTRARAPEKKIPEARPSRLDKFNHLQETYVKCCESAKPFIVPDSNIMKHLVNHELVFDLQTTHNINHDGQVTLKSLVRFLESAGACDGLVGIKFQVEKGEKGERLERKTVSLPPLLAKFLNHSKSLQHLEIEGMKLSATDCKSLGCALKDGKVCHQIISISLKHCTLGDGGFKELMGALMSCTQLTYLNLAATGLTAESGSVHQGV